MDPAVRSYLADIGRKGGRKSKRTLDSDTARDMVRVREARRAFRKYYASCFWSSPRDLKISLADVDWVVENLKKHGNMEAWRTAHRLCR